MGSLALPSHRGAPPSPLRPVDFLLFQKSQSRGSTEGTLFCCGDCVGFRSAIPPTPIPLDPIAGLILGLTPRCETDAILLASLERRPSSGMDSYEMDGWNLAGELLLLRLGGWSAN